LSDIWSELEERLKQKAKTTNWIYETYFRTEDLHALTEWVRLEDVKEAIQQLKQNYVLVKIGDLEAIVCTSTDYDSLRDIVDDFCGNYDDVAREAYALGMKDLAKRLLKNVKMY